MVEKRLENIMDVCGLIAKILLESGAETTRVESTIAYIGQAAGIDLNWLFVNCCW